MDNTALILSPHSDDAALSVPSTIRLLQRGGHEVKVLTCFSRSNWAPERKESEGPEVISQVRVKEDETFAGMMGSRVQAIPLGLDDFPLRHPSASSPILPGQAPESQVVADLVRAIYPHLSHARLLFAPLGLGNHLDHGAVTAATILLSDHLPTVFYEDIPYRLALGEDEIRSRVGWAADQRGTPIMPLLVNRTDSGALWLRAASCYPSQFTNEEFFQMKEKLALTPGERLWATDPDVVLRFFS